MKAKQFFFGILSLLAWITPFTANAYDAKINGIYYNFSGSNAEVTYQKYENQRYVSDYTGTVVIPTTVTNSSGKTYSVTSIGEFAFWGCKNLTSVSIPNSVTSIGFEAFHGCTNLSSISIPNSVTSIGVCAFELCTSLTSVTIPQNVTDIGWGVFDDCRSLASIRVATGNTTYDSRNSCNAIIESATNTLIAGCKNTNIPTSVTNIGTAAFEGCTGLNSISIPSSVTHIGLDAFWGCSNLTSVTIPNSVTTIDGGAFGETAWYNNKPDGLVYAGKVAYTYKGTMPNGTQITLKDGTLGIAGQAFDYCSQLTSINIPSSVTNIGDRAFECCTGLTSIIIPNGVTNIGDMAFYGCSKLNNITIPNSVTTIEGSAFDETAWYNNKPDGLVYAGKVAYRYKGTMPDGTQITLEDGTLGIAGYAFYNRSQLTSITIPNSVTNIGDGAFMRCSNLGTISIPNSVTKIGDDAFSYCYRLYDVWCYAEIVPSTSSNTFYDSNIGSATLHVPAASLGAYSNTAPWSGFGTKVAIMISVNGIALSQQSLQMTEGDVVTIIATISPSNASNKEVIWSSSNTDVATVSNGVITAISAGEAIITVTAADGSGVTSQCAVTVKLREQKDLIYSEGYGNWTSSYKYDDCYESKTFSFYAEKGDEITFDWVTSSESGYDFLIVFLDGNSILSESGENSGNYSNTIESDGTHTLVVSWSKDYSESIGNDEVSVKNIFVNHYSSMYYKFNETSLGSWTSTNHDDDSTDSKTINFVSEEGDILNFDYSISSEDDYDIGYVFLDGVCIISVSGYDSSTFRHSLGSGSHTVICEYIKDGSVSSGGDYFSISNITISHKDIVSSTGLNSVPLSSDAKSIQIYKEYDAPCSYTVDTNNMKWQSFMLPFELSYTDWYDKVEIAEIDSIVAVYDSDGITVLDIDMYTTIIDKGTIVPNKPYLVRNLQNTSVTLSNDYAKLKNNSNNIHSYTYANVVASVYPVYSQLNSNNYWVVGNELSKTNRIMSVFHWYMKLTDKNSGNILNFSNSIDIHVQYPLRGDVNCDGEVDVVDVVDIARFVVGTPAETFVEILADINYDGSVNIGDAVTLVNEIAGDQNFVKAMRAPRWAETTDEALRLMAAGNGLSLILENQRDYTAFQFDLFVPEGTDVAQMLLNAQRKQKHQLLYNKVEEGHYRVAALSTSNRTFQGNDGELLSFVVGGGGDVSIRDIHFFTPDGSDYRFEALYMNYGAETGISSIENEIVNGKSIYDLNGRKMVNGKLPKGIYIVNGKKVFIK